MIRRSLVVLSKASSSSTRTVVRDPRKAAKKVAARNRAVVYAHPTEGNPNLPAKTQQQMSLPFQPSHRDQESVGSALASYALAGVGVAMGVTLVGALFGGF